MAIQSPKTSYERELVSAGSHIARVYQIVHIGTVPENYMGEDKQVDKVRIGFELPNETKVFNEEKGEQPFVISQEYTNSMHEKANLRHIIEGMLGVGFLEEEASSFDIAQIMGATCLVNVIHKKSQNTGKNYEKIMSASPLPKGTEAPSAVNPPFLLDYDNFSDEKFDKLPDFIKNKIVSSDEYKKLKGIKEPVEEVLKEGDIPF